MLELAEVPAISAGSLCWGEITDYERPDREIEGCGAGKRAGAAFCALDMVFTKVAPLAVGGETEAGCTRRGGGITLKRGVGEGVT